MVYAQQGQQSGASSASAQAYAQQQAFAYVQQSSQQMGRTMHQQVRVSSLAMAWSCFSCTAFSPCLIAFGITKKPPHFHETPCTALLGGAGRGCAVFDPT